MSTKIPEAKPATWTDEYWEVARPFLAKFSEARAPHWARYLAGEIDHTRYCELIAPAFRQYANEIHPHFIAAGGVPLQVRPATSRTGSA